MSDLYAPQYGTKTASEVRTVSIDCRGLLDDGETLTGTPTVAEVTTSDLTLSNAAVNSGTRTIDGGLCAAGQAIMFQVSGGTAGSTYRVVATCGTSTDPANTIKVGVVLRVIGDT